MKLECAGNFMMGLEAGGMCIQRRRIKGQAFTCVAWLQVSGTVKSKLAQKSCQDDWHMVSLCRVPDTWECAFH